MCSLHYGHPGRESMLAMIEDIWWPQIHREVIDQARLCKQCLESVKNLKCISRQKQIGKLPEVKQLDPFQNAKKGKTYILVSIDHFSSWPEARCLHRSSSPFEKQMGQKPNTVKSNLVRGLMDISEQDPNLKFSPSDFQDELNSSILVREKARDSKLEGRFKTKSDMWWRVSQPTQ